MLTLAANAQPLTPSELAGTNVVSFRTDFPPSAQDQMILTLINSNIQTVLVGTDETPGWYYSTNVMPTNGTLSGFNSNSGAITYSPTTNFVGVDFFNFVVHEVDGSLTATGNVNVAVFSGASGPSSSNCFSVVSNTVLGVCALPSKTICTTHSPPQSSDGCITSGGGSTSCQTITNLADGTICVSLTIPCGSVSSDPTNLLYSPFFQLGSGIFTTNNGTNFTFDLTAGASARLILTVPFCNTNASKKIRFSGVITYTRNNSGGGYAISSSSLSSPFTYHFQYVNTFNSTPVTLPLSFDMVIPDYGSTPSFLTAEQQGGGTTHLTGNFTNSVINQ